MEFEIDGHTLRVDRLSAFDQFHLSRKISPLLPPLAPVLVKYMGTPTGELLGSKLLEIAELTGPFTEAIAGMSNDTAEQVLQLALSRVFVLTDPAKNVWMPLWNGTAKMASVMEFNELGKLLPVVVRVILFNLGNFIDGLLMHHGEKSPPSNGAPSQMARIG